MIKTKEKSRIIFLPLYTNFVYNMTNENIPKVRTMSIKTVNISLREDLLKKIDAAAKKESRTRSELIREASRMYIEKKERWGKIFEFGSRQTARLGLTAEDVNQEIKKFRNRKRRNP